MTIFASPARFTDNDAAPPGGGVARRTRTAVLMLAPAVVGLIDLAGRVAHRNRPARAAAALLPPGSPPTGTRSC